MTHPLEFLPMVENPGIQISLASIPGFAVFQSLFGTVFGLLFMLAILMFGIGGVVWAVGSFSSSPSTASGGKTTMLAALAAGFVLGAAGAVVTWMANLGSAV